jgi:Fe-S-cluster-containing dehydrogenase component/CRP-like cAMP-binding protein
MKSGLIGITRPKRWDLPFSEEREDGPAVSPEEIDQLLANPPFSDLDAEGFRKSLPLRAILENDARFVSCEVGDIIVREGDWGNSAFFLLSGSVRVELSSAESSLPAEILGRRETKRKSLFQAIAQLWSNHREPEFREPREHQTTGRTQSRGSGDDTRIYLQDVSAVLDQYRTAQIEAGQWFGEIAALGRTPRVATVFADSKTRLLEIRWQGLRDLMRYDRHGALKQHIEDVFRERALASFLRNSPIFRHVTKTQMAEIVAKAEFDTYGSYDSVTPFEKTSGESSDHQQISHEPVVAEEGHHSDSVILIRSGLARVSHRHHHGHRTITYLMPGQIFGMDEARRGWQASHATTFENTLTAIGYLNIVKIPTPLIEEFVFHPKNKAADTPTENEQRQHKRDRLKVDDNLMNFLVDGRYVQGTATMIIDLDRCTRCDDCVRACATTHDGNSRFIRHGPTHSHYMIANACLHCSDPVCMIECPTGAIHRDLQEGQVVINDQTCIGCTRCANNCSYNAIRMVEIRDETGRFVVDSKSGRPLQQATKCDLCVEQPAGPACQSACPHDALIRMDMRNVVSLENYFNR